jgi:hypothetical protein
MCAVGFFKMCEYLVTAIDIPVLSPDFIISDLAALIRLLIQRRPSYVAKSFQQIETYRRM